MVVVGTTALWLTLRGDGQVLVSEAKFQATSAKVRVQRPHRKLREAKQGDGRAAFHNEKDVWCAGHPDVNVQVG